MPPYSLTYSVNMISYSSDDTIPFILTCSLVDMPSINIADTLGKWEAQLFRISVGSFYDLFKTIYFCDQLD